MNAPARRTGRHVALLWILFAFGIVLAFKVVGDRYFGAFTLDLGSGRMTAPEHTAFLALWGFFGLWAAVALTYGVLLLLPSAAPAGRRQWLLAGESDRLWIAGAMILALVLALAIRSLVLLGEPVTDDESSYRFSAQLLAQGRLVGDSPPQKIFFDRSFMINDGRFYSQYFLGWPALMLPFLLLGASGVANAFFSALTAPAVFLVARRVTGAVGARLALVVYLSSPFLMIAAATELSHTSCLAALVWMTWAVLRARDPDARGLHHALAALLFCVAFFVRPLAAIGLGLPWLGWWLLGVAQKEPRERLRAVLAFAVPSLLLGALFLWINAAQNGSIFKSAYSAALDYARANGFRFTHWTERTTLSVSLSPARFVSGLANTAVALFRLNGAAFGWPASLALLPLAWGARGAAPWWASLASFLLFHWTLLNVGIDSFGPVHYLEATWPVLLLSVLGVVRVTRILEGVGPGRGGVRWSRAPAVLLLAFVALGMFGYLPPRLRALHAMSEVVHEAMTTPEREGLRNAVVFAPRWITRNCDRPVPATFVHWRPNPDPAFEDPVIWANHITIAEDRRLMESFPDRKGYVFGWARGCKGALVPLDDPRADGIPSGST